jgi:hypothetical protein
MIHIVRIVLGLQISVVAEVLIWTLFHLVAGCRIVLPYTNCGYLPHASSRQQAAREAIAIEYGYGDWRAFK